MRATVLAVVFVAFAAAPSLVGAAEKGVPNPPVSVGLSPLYAPLFVDGREWRFRVETVSEDAPDDPLKADGPVRDAKVTRATCRVAKVVRWETALGSRIECTGAL